MKKAQAANSVTEKTPNGIRVRRPVQIQFRLTVDENDALWAMHVKTMSSKSAILRKLVVDGLRKHGFMDADTAKRILEQEKKSNSSVRPPVL